MMLFLRQIILRQTHLPLKQCALKCDVLGVLTITLCGGEPLTAQSGSSNCKHRGGAWARQPTLPHSTLESEGGHALAIHRKKALLVTRASSRRSQQAAPPLGTGVSGCREHPSQGGWRVYPAGSSEGSPGPAPGSSSSTRPIRPQSSAAGAEDGLPAATTAATNQPGARSGW